MALAERADLVARLTLEDRFSSTLSKIEGKLGTLDTRIGGIARSTSFVGRTLSTAFGVALDRAISSGIGALGGAIRGGVDSLQELEALALRTNAVLKSTGGVAGQSAQDVRRLAESFEDLTTFDDKAIQNTENLLLTFTNIRKEGFEPALQAVLDLNAALGGGNEGLQGTAIQVGKALQDPIRGLVALRRVGVAFSADQEKTIRTLVKEGKLYEAQKVILGELQREFGGQAGAFGQGRAADVRRLQDAVEDFQRTLAEGLAPAFDNARKGLTQLLRDPAILRDVKDLGEGIASLFTPENIRGGIDALKGVIATVREAAPVIKEAAIVSGNVLRAAIGLFQSLPKPLQTAAIVALTANKLTGGAVGSVVKGLLELGLSGLRTITAANVTVIGASVTGGGVPGVAAAGSKVGGLANAVRVLGSVSIAGASLIALAEVFSSQQAAFKEQTTAIDQSVTQQITGGASLADLQQSLAATDKGIADLQKLVSNQGSNVVGAAIVAASIAGPLADLQKERERLTKAQAQLQSVVKAGDYDQQAIISAKAAEAARNAARETSATDRVYNAVERVRAAFQNLPAPVVTVNVSTSISASKVQDEVKVSNTWNSGRIVNQQPDT